MATAYITVDKYNRLIGFKVESVPYNEIDSLIHQLEFAKEQIGPERAKTIPTPVTIRRGDIIWSKYGRGIVHGFNHISERIQHRYPELPAQYRNFPEHEEHTEIAVIYDNDGLHWTSFSEITQHRANGPVMNF